MNFLWEHTYGAGKSHWSFTQTFSRLKELTPASVAFEGNITGPPQDSENDGDLHFNVTPDNAKDNFDLLDQHNVDRYNKKVLVVEIICWDKPNYNKYNNFQGHFCDNVTPKAQIPPLIRVTGKWVQDV